MANFNNGKYLEQAIESVCKQSRKDWELLLIDDASTDNSRQIIELYCNDERIKLFYNEKNIGYIGSLQKIIFIAEAEIVGVLDSDDALTQNALENVLKVYENNKNCRFLYSQFAYCDKNLNFIKRGRCKKIPTESCELFERCISAFRTFKKELYFEVGGFDKKSIYAEDRDLYYKFEEVTKPFFLDEILYYYRVLPSSQSHDSRKQVQGIWADVIARHNSFIRRKKTGYKNLSKKNINEELFGNFLYAFKTGYYFWSFKLFLRLFYCYNFDFLNLKNLIFDKISKNK